MSNIKIFTSYHKKCELLKNKYIYPIQVGTDVNGIIYEDTLHDNTGDNISGKNGMYCELTAQYWAWKNTDADYYGFMHYRRYFSFNPSQLEEDTFGNVLYERLDAQAVEDLRLNEKTIESFVNNYDVICTEGKISPDLGRAKPFGNTIKIRRIIGWTICRKFWISLASSTRIIWMLRRNI